MLPLIVLCALPMLSAVSAHGARTSGSALPDAWFHPEDHPVHQVFKRADATFPDVGSPQWRAKYPSSKETIYDFSKMPKAWTDALNAAVAAGKIPDVPISKSPDGGNPVYPAGFDPEGKVVCSSTYKTCKSNGDIWNAPDGMLGVGFDDGPTAASPRLYEFLQQHQETSTQFMIGINILQNPSQFTLAYNTMKFDIAGHTYTHPHLTTLTNMQILAELGWTSQIIYDSTGGKAPKYMRPPTGDSDNRVRAIAKEVFGMTMILWNQDTEDWSISVGGTTPAIINSSMTKWLSGPKSPGLIILEHELTDQTVQAFMDAYPVIKQHGWNTRSVVQLGDNRDAYHSGVLVGNGSDSAASASASSTSSNNSTTTAKSTSGASSTSASASKQSTTAPANSAHSVLIGVASPFALAACAILLSL